MSDLLDDVSGPENSPGEANAAAPAVWQSLSEFKGRLGRKADGDSKDDVAAYVDREFPTDDFDQLNGITDVDRRRFMQILGASAALAGASSCRWEKENILPYNERPENTVPGKAKHFATVMDLGGAARPLKVTSFDGRPVKVEPNTNVGPGTDVYSQGEILGFYDPDRARGVGKRDADGKLLRSSWEEAMTTLKGAHDAGQLAVLAQATSSPTFMRLAAELGRLVVWSPVNRDNAIAGSEAVFGKALRPRYDLKAADVVVSLDCDFQRDHPDAVRLAADFATRRMPDGDVEMSRLYAVESRFSSTGVTADHRLPVKSSEVGAVLELLAAELNMGGTPGAGAQALASNAKVKAFVAAAAKDIQAADGKAVILPGNGQPAAVHARAQALNVGLRASGKTVDYIDETLPGGTDEALASLVGDMNAGRIKALLILGGNPVYDAPADLDFKGALAKVETTAHLSLYRDETTAVTDWSLAQAHWLEAWGDARSWDGHMHVAQPLISAPITDGKSAIEVVAGLLGRPESARELVRETHGALGDGDYRRAIHDGVVAGSRPAGQTPGASSNLPAIQAPAAGTEVTFFPCPKIYDGRFANNGWLQELPDFTTKMTWDNAALIGVATAKAMGVDTGDMLDVNVGGRTLSVAAYVAAGQAEDSIAIALGYGRNHAGLVAGSDEAKVDAAGFNGYALRGTDSMSIAAGATVSKGKGSYEFATTQEHHLIDEIGMKGRRERLHKLVMETDLHNYEEHPDHFKHDVYHVPPRASLFDQKVYKGQHQWGMTIDLSTCNGCNACVIACQSENNIPIVGKEQVKRGREMHWMRVDLYFQGDAEDATTVDAVNQPINCLQCENAPCEQVCPVAATVHGEEGTNDMVYNRCIGTRYCGNNCPVKVRRFNYFHYTKYMDEPEHKRLQLAQNPNVTVRSRGVMEKCTYCAQRISEARIVARNEGRKIRDGEVITACQASCPTQAITFGDITDQESEVSKKMRLNRDYAMLEELGIRPRTQYLARISNPNGDLAKAMPQGLKGRDDWDELKKIVEPGHGGHGHGEGESAEGAEAKDDHGHGGHGHSDKPARPGPWDYVADHSHEHASDHSEGGNH